MTEGNPRGMSLDSESMMLLMAFADGELEGDERVRAEALISASEEAKTFVENLRGLGGAVRVIAEPPATHRYDVAENVMAKLGALSGAPTMERAAVVALPSKPKRSVGRVGVAIAGAFALAASVALMTRPKPIEETGGSIAARTSAPSASAEAVASATAGVEVERVESPTHPFSVFYVPSANESPSVVIWIDDSTSGSGGE